MRKQDVLEYLENAYSFLMDPAIGRAIDEIKRLREDKAELVEALNIAADGFMDSGEEDLEDMCRAVIAKATGGDDV